MLCLCRSRDFAGVILLSLSMAAKHIMFAFPLWILLNQNFTLRKKILYAFIPPLVFLLSFIPYWAEGSQGIISNVIRYASSDNFPLLGIPVLTSLGLSLPSWQYVYRPLFVLLMLAVAYFFRREKPFRLFLLYTMALVCFSSAIANQYIAIPCMALILLMRKKSAPYFLLGLAFLTCELSALHIPYHLQRHYGIAVPYVLDVVLQNGVMYSFFTWFLLFCLLYCRKAR